MQHLSSTEHTVGRLQQKHQGSPKALFSVLEYAKLIMSVWVIACAWPFQHSGHRQSTNPDWWSNDSTQDAVVDCEALLNVGSPSTSASYLLLAMRMAHACSMQFCVTSVAGPIGHRSSYPAHQQSWNGPDGTQLTPWSSCRGPLQS